MRSKNLLLLRTLLKSTSLWNIRKYSKDRKKRGRILGGFFGFATLYLMLVLYSYFGCFGLYALGLIEVVPVMAALTVSTIAFVFTFIKTNGYLLNFKEYDMLMALPFAPKDVAACRFEYMYLKTLPWFLSVSLPMMVGYGVFAKPSWLVYPVWMILGFFVPVIPMLAASLLGFLIAKASSGFKKKNLVQTFFTVIFVILAFSLRYIIEAIIRKNQVVNITEQASAMMDLAGKYYLPAGWFASAIQQAGRLEVGAFVDAVLLIVSTVVLFELVFLFVGKHYRQINSALTSHAVKRNYRMAGQKSKSVYNAIAFKEWKRLTASTTYFVNGAMGEILTVVLGIAVLIVGMDRVIAIVTQNAPIPKGILNPAIPLIIYFLIGMMTTTACSPSLEGKNYWIVQSLPITKKTLYLGKLLFQLYLSVPFMLFGTLCMSISAHVALIDLVLYLILGFLLCVFSASWGLVCGIKHMRLDWENEVEVIKQGAAVMIYLFPNMFVTMGLIVLVVWLGTVVNPTLVTLILIAVAGILAALSYVRVLRLAKE
jgi:ABC-2 type transport system permease protein